MLEKTDLKAEISKEDFKARMDELEVSLNALERKLWEKKIATMIVVEGLDAAGKGEVINKLILPMTPKDFTVYAESAETEEERMHPYFWRFWSKTPEKGRIAIFDGSWYKSVLIDRFDGTTKKKDLPGKFEDINTFEQMLADDGVLVLKFFLYISKKEQKKRFEKLLSSKATKWRVTKQAVERNKHYAKYVEMAEDMLAATNSEFAPWTIVEAEQIRYAELKLMEAVEKAFADRIEEAEKAKKPVVNGKFSRKKYETQTLSKVTPLQEMTFEEYKEKKAKLTAELRELHGKLYQARIPVVLCFEGWDAAGKGGAIHRLTNALDPRGYVVNPVSAPNDIEKAHHYLWRFWTKVPKDGHIAIFDRSWYGRVMVERIEGFCSENDWQRAYREMNQMEKQFANHGAIVLKFWLQIDKDEQEKRFTERQNNPDKNWKITDEDFRNREKWDLYEQAVDEMLMKTSTNYAPWIIVEGNNKYYARIKVLETVAKALRERL
ncbi:MAG: polyphosphate:AMP phosphotransferase [Lachnospiraceae bacterium]|nr:polyphosphate:AMP phosphotransferase [Lachnospiraceae bacterium]